VANENLSLPLFQIGGNMANVDEHGNKIAAKKEKKSVLSQRKRERRIMQGQNINPAFCNECGFRIRGKNHLNEKHHKSVEN